MIVMILRRFNTIQHDNYIFYICFKLRYMIKLFIYFVRVNDNMKESYQTFVALLKTIMGMSI